MPYDEYKWFEGIPHYYGDYVRILFLSTAALAFFAIPVWGNMLEFGVIFEILAGLLLVLLAGLTSPQSKGVMMLNILVAALGAFMLELTAVSYQAKSSFILLSVREAGAILLIIALYFSVKTLRAMIQGKIGEAYNPEDFIHEKPEHEYVEDRTDDYDHYERDTETDTDTEMDEETRIEPPHKKHLANPEMEYY